MKRALTLESSYPGNPASLYSAPGVEVSCSIADRHGTCLEVFACEQFHVKTLHGVGNLPAFLAISVNVTGEKPRALDCPTLSLPVSRWMLQHWLASGPTGGSTLKLMLSPP